MRENREVAQPNVNPELKGFQIKINEFGQMEQTRSLDNLNAFLNAAVNDKKLESDKAN